MRAEVTRVRSGRVYVSCKCGYLRYAKPQGRLTEAVAQGIAQNHNRDEYGDKNGPS